MENKFKWVLDVCYDGTNLRGFQRQPEGMTVQSELERVLSKLYDSPIIVQGSGRTDSGVHGLSQPVSFTPANSRIDEASLIKGMNALLTPAIKINGVRKEDEGFHASFSAVGKTYVYVIDNRDIQQPFMRNFSWHWRGKLDLELMQECADLLVGEHDFSKFCASATKYEGKTVRKIFSLDVIKDEDKIFLSVTGGGFLYRMVRIIAGHLLEAGRGKIGPEITKNALAGQINDDMILTAPAGGLYLARVYYSEAEMKKSLELHPRDFFKGFML